MTTRPMTEGDVLYAIELWRLCEGVGLSEGDTLDAVVSFLSRNVGTSWVSIVHGQVVGAVLAGHDGRRGFLYHLAVHPGFRRRGFGAALVESSLGSLRDAGVLKCHVMVFRDNASGQVFWNRLGFGLRTDIDVCTRVLDAT